MARRHTLHEFVMREAASTGSLQFRPTAAQVDGLRMVAKRDWPAGEPRVGWINMATARVLLREELIAERPDSADRMGGNILDLTPAGRAVLASTQGGIR